MTLADLTTVLEVVVVLLLGGWLTAWSSPDDGEWPPRDGGGGYWP
jgi:hypothetical protein